LGATVAEASYEIRDVTPEGHATHLFAVIQDLGWCERILCGDCYQADAELICECLTAFEPYRQKREGDGG